MMRMWQIGCKATIAALGLYGAGCVGLTEFVNPSFLSQVGLGETAATLPGEAPAVIVEVENRAGRIIDARVSWRTPEGTVDVRNLVVPVDSKISEALICPIDEMTLGDVSDPSESGAVVRLGAGTAADPIIFVEPFGVVLKEGVNYSCGDSITFTVMPSSQTLSGYQVFAFIRRADTSVTVP